MNTFAGTRSFLFGLLTAHKAMGKRGRRVYRNFRRLVRASGPFPSPTTSAHLLERRAMRWLILLPSASLGGGTKVVLTEARRLRGLGVDVWIGNNEFNRPAFSSLVGTDDPPVVYFAELTDAAALTTEFDVVIATAWWTVGGLRAIAAVSAKTKLAYYIQDFEPHFYASSDDQHRAARASYHIRNCILFTKTRWNQAELYREEGVEAMVVGPSYDDAVFHAAGRVPGAIARVCAMVRPATPRRAPLLTMRVLRRLKEQYGEQLHVAIFGCTEDELKDADLEIAFRFENAGLLNSAEVADLLRRTDIFVDFSAFQAMGLTAMEAMACGAAVVGPSQGGLQEIITHRVTGLLVDTSNEEICYSAVAALIDSPELRAAMATAAGETVQRFKPEDVARRMIALFGPS